MNTIIKNYNLLVNKYQKIEVEITENEIHDKRVILRRIFQILAAYKMNPSKVKNGEKAFKLFGKLRDIQVQKLKLESVEQTPGITDYLESLNDKEVEIKEKVRKFCKKKELEFPAIKKKYKLDKSKIYSKITKSLDKLIERVQSKSIDDAEDIHKIRIAFKKFRYKVEVLSFIEPIEDSKLEMLKMFQDKLGDIQDYEVLIKGIKKYCKKRKIEEDEMIEQFEQDQNTLIENFDNQIELFTSVCKDAVILKKVIELSVDALNESDKSELEVNQPDLNQEIESSSKEKINGIIESLVTNIDKTTDNKIANCDLKEPQFKNAEPDVMEENKENELNGADILKATKKNSKMKRLTDKDIAVDSDF
jgi:CHAD domain-containing protein